MRNIAIVLVLSTIIGIVFTFIINFLLNLKAKESGRSNNIKAEAYIGSFD